MSHKPVLLKEVIEYLRPLANQNFIDCTLGNGGHAKEILKHNDPNGKVLGIDLNPPKIKEPRLIVVKGNFKNLKAIVNENNFRNIHGILIDLGASSMQLDEKKQGFGFESERLDMRMDKDQGLTAEEIVNTWPAEDLMQMFRDYSEENLAGQIAQKIEKERKIRRITNPKHLVDIINKTYHKFYKKPSRKNPATKVFQALRIAVNDEFKNLRLVLPQAIHLLQPGGRLAIISFHSLEDREVKNFFKLCAKECVCPPEFPICQCNHQKSIEIITRKPIVPSEAEINQNPRSRSAKMRVAEKIKI